jgi:hypothetical protein
MVWIFTTSSFNRLDHPVGLNPQPQKGGDLGALMAVADPVFEEQLGP